VTALPFRDRPDDELFQHFRIHVRKLAQVEATLGSLVLTDAAK